MEEGISNSETSGPGLSYKDAGVDIDAGNALVEAIKPLAKSTDRPGVASGLGGFGGLFDLKAAGFKDPVLIAATDGVGTKLKVAINARKHDTVGIDLVAMCVNDLVVQGAEPLFFLDYYATGKLDVEIGRAIISGIAEGCRQAGSALIGGETAEMPGMYGEGDYDLAGFAVGAAERDQLLGPDQVQAGDVILGLRSSGLHSNGFSLVRRVVQQRNLDYQAAAPFDQDKTLAEIMLAPTRIYVKACLAAIRTGGVHGLSHITGGGLLENLPRVYGDDLAAEIDATSWTPDPVFGWLKEAGYIEGSEMLRTFNCGIGMAVITAADKVDAVIQALEGAGETVRVIGHMIRRSAPAKGVIIQGGERLW